MIQNWYARPSNKQVETPFHCRRVAHLPTVWPYIDSLTFGMSIRDRNRPFAGIWANTDRINLRTRL